MKKSLMILLLTFTISNGIAQEYIHINVNSPQFSYTPISINQHQFNFSIGILDYYIPTMSSVVEVVNDTLEVKMYYDITQQVVNVSNLNIYNNVVYYNQELPPNVTHIKMSTNVILIEDNPPYNVITVESLYYRIIDLSNLGQETLNKTTTNIFPNPASDKLTINADKSLDKVTFYNSVGQEVLTINPKSPTLNIDINQLKAGIYMVSLQSNNQIETKKIIIE
ncbi:MAG: T9SS type A sorting domain-containing protein [Bacteroidetes bacterium]|nr:T9SS type A sorting domain-containing protein [Bacteroidota bacterium]